MALQASTESPATIASYLESHAKPTYLVVYASPRSSDGQSWCGDCRRAEPLITKKLSAKAEHVKIVNAGSEAEWRDPTNPWRKSPFMVKKLPTIIKVTDSHDEGHCCVDGQCGIDEEADDTLWTRLVEEDCYDEKKLNAFVEK